MVSYLTSIATMAVSLAVSEVQRLIGRKSRNFTHPLLLGTPG